MKRVLLGCGVGAIMAQALTKMAVEWVHERGAEVDRKRGPHSPRSRQGKANRWR